MAINFAYCVNIRQISNLSQFDLQIKQDDQIINIESYSKTNIDYKLINKIQFIKNESTVYEIIKTNQYFKDREIIITRDEVSTICFLISQNNKANDVIIYLNEMPNNKIYGGLVFTTNGVLNQFNQDTFSISLSPQWNTPIYDKCINVAESIK